MKRMQRFLNDGQYLEVSPDSRLPLNYIYLELSDGQAIVPQARLDVETVRELVSVLTAWLTERQE